MRNALRGPALLLLLGAVTAIAAGGPVRDVREVEGFVVFPAGTPADEDVALLALAVEAHGTTSQVIHRTPLDVSPTGAFRAVVPASSTRVRLVLSGRYLRNLDVTLPVEEPLELRPELGGRVVGRVRSTRFPVCGQRVELRVQDPSHPRRRDSSRHFVTTDDGGAFQFDALVGTARVLIQSADHVPWASQVDVHPGETVELAADLLVGGSITGRLVCATDAPFEDYCVTFERVTADGARAISRGTFARADGTFTRRNLPPGLLRLGTSVGGPSDGSLEVQLAAGDHLQGIELRVAPPVSIAGRLEWEDGTRFVDDIAWVECYPESGAEGTGGAGCEDGRFRVDRLEQGTSYLIQATVGRLEDQRAVGYGELSGVRVGDGPIVIRLRPPATVSGIVRDPTGRAVPGRVSAAGAGQHTTRADEDGRFDLFVFQRGEVRLFGTTEGVGPGQALPLEVTGTETITGLELGVGAGSSALRGTVVVPLGHAQCTRVDVTAPPEPATRPHGDWSTFTDPDAAGAFEVTHLPAGSVRVDAWDAEHELFGSRELELAPGANTCTLTLESRASDDD